MSGSIKPFGSASVGTSPRHTICPVKRGASAPYRLSRTAERMPSAPITMSALAVLPFAKARVAPSAVCVTPVQRADEPHAFRRQRLLEHGMQVGAVRAEIAGPVLRAEHALHLRRRHDGAALPVAHDMAVRLEGDRLESLVEAEPDQHAHGVGAELDAGADLAELIGACS